MIFVCELSFLDGAHVPFNAGFLAMVRAAFPEEDLCFFGAAQHIEDLKAQVGESLAATISWQEIFPPSLGTTYFRRFFRELRIIRRLLRSLANDSGRLVCTSAYPSTLLALKLARYLRSSRANVQVVLHGYLSGVVGKRHRHPVRRFQDMKTSLTIFGNQSIQYIVLEESIRDAVLKNVRSLAGKVEALDHPLSPNESGSPMNHFRAPIRLGFLGLASESKGFPLFVELANEMTSKYRHQVEFHAVGRLPADGSRVMGLEALATKPGLTRVSRTDFIEGVVPLHFVILPHAEEYYGLSASGVLLDAIAWEKPLVARSIPIFENLFKKHGDIGYLFNNDRELMEIVARLVQTVDEARYQRQVFNIRKAQSSRTPSALAASYLEICRKQEAAVPHAHSLRRFARFN